MGCAQSGSGDTDPHWRMRREEPRSVGCLCMIFRSGFCPGTAEIRHQRSSRPPNRLAEGRKIDSKIGTARHPIRAVDNVHIASPDQHAGIDSIRNLSATTLFTLLVHS